MGHNGSKPGRKLIYWKDPPLLYFKQLAVVMHRLGTPMSPELKLHEEVAKFFPFVMQNMGEKFTFKDVLTACEKQGGRYTPYILFERVWNGVRKHENWATEEVVLPIQNSFLEVNRQPVSKPRQKGSFPDSVLREAGHIHGNWCYWCEAPFSEYNRPVGDHYIPEVSGGLTVLWNCVPACKRCNDEKHDMMPDQYRKIMVSRGMRGRANFKFQEAV
jgi:hypothetical protein